MHEQQAKQIIASERPDDKVNQTKTMYDVSTWSVFWKNFIAGLGRAIGSMIFFIFILVMFSLVFAKFFLPKFQPYIDGYMSALDTIKTLNSGPQVQFFDNESGGESNSAIDIKQLLSDPKTQDLLKGS